ncbi:hypothetical protein BJQ94_02790 [Cryobacterium sp. SO2]|uniref:hypothetical protein n=1 Tax=Cryobacterium sp. SO2 TaxID=1897060 RepID=UPI00223C8CF2|nr:hypothetical protein [Cryobacterium sp. SO2]WEO77985.1 hypothetical protein BJQ94_02790 [Cryobacterium sp. SO2]
MTRWSVPRLISHRGAGLGNEVFPWAKAYLGARALGLRHVNPPWRINTRRYDRELNSGHTPASARYLALRALPKFDVSQESLAAINQSDYFDAMLKLGPIIEARRAPVLLHSTGMQGGYLGIRRARPFLQREILGAAGALSASEELQSAQEPCVRIGVHIRGGDFTQASTVTANAFNERLPLDWYVDMASSLTDALAVPAQVYLATDAPSASLNDAFTIDGRRPLSIASDSVGDLAVLSSCDIVISSVSSFSMLAIFLSDAPYVWHREQLGERSGWLSIWGHEAEEMGGGKTATSVRAQAEDKQVRVRRGIAQGQSPVWPAEQISGLESRARSRRLSDDLIYYGVSEPSS